MGADHVRDVLAEIFRRGGMKRAVRRAEAVLLWPQAVGSELAKFSEAKTLRDGVLIVEVPDSETAMHLTMQRDRFLRSYRDRLGVRELREIRFVVGRPEFKGDASTDRPSRPPPDPVELASLSRSLGALDLPEDVAVSALAAGKAWLAHRARLVAEGWKPCAACGALTPNEDMCDTCRRYREEPRVLSAAARLVMEPAVPTPHLSEDERAVAKLLARTSIDDMLVELLPQVLADPALRNQLEQIALRSLALELDKPLADVTEEDFARLDPRVARVLGRWNS